MEAVGTKIYEQQYNAIQKQTDLCYDTIVLKMTAGQADWNEEQGVNHMEKLELYIPRLEELWFYQQMTSDPETMSYNAGWDVDYAGYHRDTGCIDCPDEALADWYDRWIGNEPDRFYAYIKRSLDGAWIGDVCFHYTPEKDWWDMGIVMYAPFRGKGYAVPALRLMLDHAFRVCGISRIHNDFEAARNEHAAWETHRKAGFRELGVENGFLHMMITKEEYLGTAQNEA